MYLNYLKIAFRNLLKHKNISIINILGLAVGITCFILIGLYVYNELNYDKFNKNGNNIYFVYQIEKSNSGYKKSAVTQDPLPNVLRNEFPGLKNVVQFNGTEMPVFVNKQQFLEKVLTVTPSVFSMFSYPLKAGNPDKVFDNINSVVLTGPTAEKYFGKENPIGKKISILNKYEFIVTGVLEPIPSNSSISFDMLFSIKVRSIMDPEFDKRWNSSGSFTFVQFDKNYSPKELESQFPYIAGKYLPEYLKGRHEWKLMPLTSIHLAGDLEDMIVPVASVKNISILALIALSILLIAIINFTNISVSMYTERIKEIGVRKTLGAGSKEIIKQYLFESVFITFASMILGVVLAELLLPRFNDLTNSELSFLNINILYSILLLVAFTALIGIIGGYYPAFYISKLQPNIAVKGIQTKKYNPVLRHFLIITQFALAGTLIIVLLIITGQIYYMHNSNLGFNPENLLSIDLHYWDQEKPEQNINRFVSEISSYQGPYGINSVAMSEHIPGYYFNNTFSAKIDGSSINNFKETIVTSIDDNFIDTYKMKLIAGRNFSRFIKWDIYDAALLNKTAVKELNIGDPIGKRLRFKHGENYLIVGVVDDIHFRSMQNKIEPVVYRYSAGNRTKFVTIKYNPVKQKEILGYLQKAWEKTIPGVPFDYFYILDKYNKSYKNETREAIIVGVFSFMAIILACLGLLGLTSLAVIQRTKEIGIRKILGSTTTNIVILLTSQYLKLVLLSNLIGWPVAYYFSSQWLQEFPYRIGLSPIYFILGSVAAILISVSAIGSLTIKAATANPLKSLKYE